MIIHIGNTDYKLTFPFAALIAFMLISKDEEIILQSFLSSVIHESGHLFFMRLFKTEISEIKFGLFGMRIDRVNEIKVSYYREILIAGGGIIFNLIFSLLCYIMYKISGKDVLIVLSLINIMIAAVNSFPVGFLDFGRVLHCIFLIFFDDTKAEKHFAAVSDIFVILFTFCTVVCICITGINLSLIIINLYLYAVIVFKKWS